jgi:hypothetical protein
MPHWTLHDLRRSFVTHVSELGFGQPHVLEAIGNHVSGSKAGVGRPYRQACVAPTSRNTQEAKAISATRVPA